MIKKIFLLYICLSYVFPLSIENIILANQYAEEMDLTTNTLWIESMKNGNYYVMYNLDEDLSGFQFNLKDFREIYGNQKVTFKNGQTKKEHFTVSYDEKSGFILGFSFQGKTLPSGVDTLFEIVASEVEKIYLEKVETTGSFSLDNFPLDTIITGRPLGDFPDTIYVDITSPEIKACQFLPVNTMSLSGNHVIYNSSYDIGGFQFSIPDGVLINKAYGGDSSESGFSLSNGDYIVLGFSFEGKTIPPGCGILLTLETDKPATLLEQIVVSSKYGETLDFKYFKY